LNPPRLSILAAIARNGVIGRGNALPWRLPEDLKRFKALTLGHAVIMGRKTFESILAANGGPLPGRENIVVTRSRDYAAAGCRVVHSLESAIAETRGAEAFIIGGAEIYALALPVAQRLYLTEIDADFEGDAVFPPYDRSEWREVTREPRAGPGSLRYDFALYERRK
jgi:dihydrofolate reductase